LRTIKLIFLSLTALSLAGCEVNKIDTDASPTAVNAENSSVVNFDISGLQIGMNRSEVDSITAQNGFTPRNDSGSKSNVSPALTYAQLVKKKQGESISDLNRTKHEGIGAMSFQKDGKEFLYIIFTPFKGGARVTGVNYSLKDPARSAAKLEEIVIRKYGEPDGELNIATKIWEGEGNYYIEGIPVKEKLQLTSLSDGSKFDHLSGGHLSLQGTVNAKAYSAALDAAALNPKARRH